MTLYLFNVNQSATVRTWERSAG